MGLDFESKRFDELREIYSSAGKNDPGDQERWLHFAIRTDLAAVVSAIYRSEGRTDAEAHLFELAKRVHKDPQSAVEWHWRHLVAKWFLRKYAWWSAVVLSWPLLWRGKDVPRYVLAAELLMPRVAISVLVGMLALCGTSPWDLFGALSARCGTSLGAVGICLAFAMGYRVLDVAKRTQRHSGVIVWRSFWLTAYGWICGWLVVGLIAWLWEASGDSRAAHYVGDIRGTYQFILPSAGCALGVVLQEFWEEKPISEPV